MNCRDGIVAYRLRKDPPPAGGADLLSSLTASMAREEWNIRAAGESAVQ